MQARLRRLARSMLLILALAVAGTALPVAAVHGSCVGDGAVETCVSDAPAGGETAHDAAVEGLDAGGRAAGDALDLLAPVWRPALDTVFQVLDTEQQLQDDALDTLGDTVTDADDPFRHLHHDADKLRALGFEAPRDAPKRRGDGIELPLGITIVGDLGKPKDRDGGSALDNDMWDNGDRYRVWVEEGEPVTVVTAAHPRTRCWITLPSRSYGHTDCADYPTLGTAAFGGVELDWINLGRRTIRPEESGWLGIHIWDSSPWGGHTYPVGSEAQPYTVLVRQDAARDRAAGAVDDRDVHVRSQAVTTGPVDPSTISKDDAEPRSRAAGTGLVPADPDLPPSTIGVAVAVASLASLLLYRRLSRDDVVEHDLRSEMLDVARDEPGIRASELADRYDAALSTILYHLRILAESDLLVAVETDDGTRYFHPDNAGTATERAVRCALRHETKGALLRTLCGSPGLSMAELARRMGCDRSTVKRHADDLIEAGIVEAEKDGRCKRLEVDDDVLDAVAA